MAYKLAIFGLPNDVEEREVEELFDRYGRCTIQIRQTKSNQTMAFVEYTDKRDADAALKARHGTRFGNGTLRVEYSEAQKGKGKGKRGDSRRRDSRRRDSRRRRGDSRARSKGYGKPEKGFGKGKGKKGLHDDYAKIKVLDLPRGASWQDLKDFLRKGGDVRFADLDKSDPSIGIGGFISHAEVRHVVDRLDDTEFKTRDGVIGRVRVIECDEPPKRGRSSSR